LKYLLTIFIFCSAFLAAGQEVKLGVPVGHPEFSISCIEISHNDRFLIVGSETGAVKLFDFETGKLLKTYKDHKKPVKGVYITSSGKRFLTYSETGVINLYSLESLEKIVSIEDYTGFDESSFLIESVDCSQSENILVISGQARYSEYSFIFELREKKGEVNVIDKKMLAGTKQGKFHPTNDQYLIFVSQTPQSSIFIYDNKKDTWEGPFIQFSEQEIIDYVYDKIENRILCYTPNTISLIDSTGNKSVSISNSIYQAGFLDKSSIYVVLKDSVLIFDSADLTFNESIANINSISYYEYPKTATSSSTTCVLVTNPNGIKRIRSEAGKISTTSFELGNVYWMLTSRSSNQVIILNYNGVLQTVDVNSGEITNSYDLTSNIVESIDIDNSSLLLKFAMNRDVVLNISDGRTIPTTNNRTLAYNKGFSKRVEIKDSLMTSIVYNLELQREISTLDTNTISACFSPLGDVLAVGFKNGIVRLYDSDYSVLETIQLDFKPYHLNYSPNGEKLAISDFYGRLKVYDAFNFKNPLWARLYNSIRGVIWSPDGRKLLVNGERGNAENWMNSLVVDEVSFLKNDSIQVNEVEKEKVLAWEFVPNSKNVLILDSEGENRFLQSNFSYTGDVLFYDEKPIRGNMVFLDDKNYIIGQGKFLNIFEITSDTLINKKRNKRRNKSLGELVGVFSGVTVQTEHQLKRSFNIHSENIIGVEQNKRMIVSVAEDGAVIFWEKKSMVPLIGLYYINADPSKWVHVHHSGLFDASPEAMELMYWTKGLEVIEFDQLKDRYWVPGLWEKVMKGEALPDVRDINTLKLQPEVDLGKIKNGELPITLTKREGGYGQVSIFINGKEVAHDARGNDLDTTKAKQTISYSIKDHPYLKNGKNTITVKASSADGFVQGRGVSIESFFEEDKKEKPSFYGVVIGVSDYANDNINLTYPEKDAEAIVKSITMGSDNLFGSDHTHVYTLTTKSVVQPTKANIKMVFDEIAEEAHAEDVIMVYLSGHGVTWGSGDQGDFYFLTSDATAANKEAYADPEIRKMRSVSTNEFVEYLKAIPALKQVMIIDACGSGKAVDNLIAARDVDGSQIKAIDRMKDRTGMYIISGCTADAVSYEASQYGQGLLTYSILQAMKGAALKENKYVDVFTIMDHARETVPKLAANIGGVQTPQLLAPKGGSFDIGILEEKDKEAIPLASPKKVFIRSMLVDRKKFRDVLGLSKMLDDELGTSTAKGIESNIVFFDAAEFGGACQISGGYSKSESGISAVVTITCGDKEETYQLEAASAQELTKKIVELVESK
jgi:WD40 repeat protein